MGLYDRDYMRADRRPFQEDRREKTPRFSGWFILVAIIVIVIILLFLF